MYISQDRNLLYIKNISLDFINAKNKNRRKRLTLIGFSVEMQREILNC